MTAQKMVVSLRGHGFKITPQRRAVLNVIAASVDHLTPAAIYERVRESDPTLGLVTVYRTLEILADLNLVCRIHGNDGCRSYLMRRPTGHHHHVVCASCGAVADFTNCDIGELERAASRQTGFEVQGHLLEFEGLCHQCSVRQKTGPPVSRLSRR